jgi:hypothetical protein
MSVNPREQTTQQHSTSSTRSGTRKSLAQRYQDLQLTKQMQLILAVFAFLIVCIVLWLIVSAISGLLKGNTAENTTSTATTTAEGENTQVDPVQWNAALSQNLVVDNLPPPEGPSATFQGSYDRFGGLRILGLPISNEMTVNGRQVQWFERARLEHWPEFAGTESEFQLGRLGAEFMADRSFPTVEPFVSQPGLQYFPETGYAVSEPFLSFWHQNGALSTFGFPISNVIVEQLSDGQAHTVQYFERARLEIHQIEGTQQIQIGLLGSSLYARNRFPETVATPHVITVPGPTTVPLP